MTVVNCIAGAVYAQGLPAKDKIQIYGMAAIFLILLYNAPAALVLYWTMNNVFSLLKHIYFKINSKLKIFILLGIVSVLCFGVSYYIRNIHTGDEIIRATIGGIFNVLALLPWAAVVIHRLPVRLPGISFSEKSMFVCFALSCAVLWVTAGLFLPSMLLASSPQEFSFIDSFASPNVFIFFTSVQAFGLFIFWPFCLYFLFSCRVKKVLSSLMFVLSICALVNIFVFPGSYGYISPVNLKFENGIELTIKEMLFNAACILGLSLVLTICFFIRKFYKCVFYIALLCVFSLSVLSLRNIYIVHSSFKNLSLTYKKPNTDIADITPLFHLSKTGKNTIVIMLDRAINVLVPSIFDETPALYEQFSGFVRYPNTVSFHKWTRLGSPPLFGGYEYTPLELAKRTDTTIVEKHNEALLLMPRIFSETGFAVTVTDQPYQNYSEKPDLSIYEPYQGINAYTTDSVYTKYWLKEHDISLPSHSDMLKRNILWYSLLKISPLVMRQSIYLSGDWCSPLFGQQLLRTLNGYAVLDYLPRLTDCNSAAENTAVIMVNNTTHEPSLLQYPEYRPSINISNYGIGPFSKHNLYHVNAAALNRLGEWFDFLKSNNVYDNTRIIIAADHGAGFVFEKEVPGLPFIVEQYNPLFLVKDFNSSGTLKTDMTFMTNADVPSIAFAGQIENPVNPFTGKPITNDDKKKPLLISIYGTIHINDNIEVLNDGDYYVHTDIFNPENWTKTGK